MNMKQSFIEYGKWCDKNKVYSIGHTIYIMFFKSKGINSLKKAGLA